MPIRPSRSCLYLSLLVSLWTSDATAFEGPAEEVALGISPESAPTILIDPEQVQALCTVVDPDEDPILGKCKATTNNGPLGKRDYETSCGVWKTSGATFDRPIVRPGSQMVLRQAADDPSRGFFSGAFDLIARVRFIHLETGRSVDVKLRFGFNLEGPWVLADPSEPITTENLILLAERDEEGQIVMHKQWVDMEDIDLYEECWVCLHPELWKVPVLFAEATP